MDTKLTKISSDMKDIANDFQKCQAAFIAMGDENRQQILMALLKNPGGMRVGDLATTISLSRPAVSHHLKILKDAQIIQMYKVGTKNFYHMEEDQNCWRDITDLILKVNDLLEDISSVPKEQLCLIE